MAATPEEKMGGVTDCPWNYESEFKRLSKSVHYNERRETANASSSFAARCLDELAVRMWCR